jgi:protein involved in polysaccharide export with SLBB domain
MNLRNTFKKLFSGIILLLIFIGSAQAQSLQDIQNIKVDNLSDAQIEQLIKRAEASGMNEMQLEAMARERGMPAAEVAKLRQRIQALRGGTTATRGTQRSGQLRQAPGMADPFDSLRRSDPYYDLSPTQKRIYGYKLFHNKQLDFSPSLNIPTPQTYTIGAGDQLLIDVYGASQQSYDVTVNPDGRVFIPNVGPIQVGGSSIAAASSRIKTSLSRIYSGLSGSNPNTFIDIRLGNIRSITVSMVGELNRPGTYTLPSFASVFNALFAAGGPSETGSFRHIQVYRDSKLVAEVDIYDFLEKGEHKGNIALRDNDVVIVQPLRNRVELLGPVRREGLFETKQGENINDLLKHAGGFTDKAYRAFVTVRRSTGTELKVEDITAEQFANFQPKDGDVFRVGEILNRFENRVQVTGAVFRPGEFALSEGMTLKSLIQKAGGLRGDAFLNRASLYRTKTDLTMEAFTVDLAGLMNGSVPDIQLQREDILNISSIYDVQEEFYVQISGEVNRIGVYAYANNLTVGDLVFKAKGFKESASNSFIEIVRRVKDNTSGKIADIILLEIDPALKLSAQDASINLQPFDHVFVRKSPGFQPERLVSVEGQVFYPGTFGLEKDDERISDLLRRSGGLNEFAYPKGAKLIRRTEFYKKIKEEEGKLKNLQSLIANMDRELDSEYMEAEVEMLKRIQARIQSLSEEARKQAIASERISEDLGADRYLALEGTDTTSIKLSIKETEFVGIDLESIIKNPGSKYDLILEEGDVLSIPKVLQTVRMRGEVLYPTTARYDDKRSFKEYISRAGGFSQKAKRGRSYVIYANGDVRRTTKALLFVNNYPKIEPGAEIIVPQKPERLPLGPQQWISIGSGLATLGLVVTQIINVMNQN